MIPLVAPTGTSTCPFGFGMNQNRLAMPIWSYAMEMFPPARVVELGSYNGWSATVLGLHARAIGAQMITYDINACDERIVPIGRALDVIFRTANVWEVEQEIAELVAGPGRVFLLCDGGDKPRELRTFARYLKPGDVIAAHDFNAVAWENTGEVPTAPAWWGYSEIFQRDGEPVAKEHGLIPFMQAHFDLAGWLAYQKSP